LSRRVPWLCFSLPVIFPDKLLCSPPVFTAFPFCFTKFNNQNQSNFCGLLAFPFLFLLFQPLKPLETYNRCKKTIQNHLDTHRNSHLVGLVNNAGIWDATTLELISLDRIRKTFEVNTLGPVRVTKAFTPLLRQAAKAGQGPRILFITSGISSLHGVAHYAPYNCTKRATGAFADNFRNELGMFGISVSVIEPGYFKTALSDLTLSTWKDTVRELSDRDDEVAKAYVKQIEKNVRVVSGVGAAGAEILSDTVEKAMKTARPVAFFVLPCCTFLCFLFLFFYSLFLLMNRKRGIGHLWMSVRAQPSTRCFPTVPMIFCC
jgi:NAD(P)-dependent dehydrogenase (short-subunit alcohol dehydrogenase family)